MYKHDISPYPHKSISPDLEMRAQPRGEGGVATVVVMSTVVGRLEPYGRIVQAVAVDHVCKHTVENKNIVYKHSAVRKHRKLYVYGICKNREQRVVH